MVNRPKLTVLTVLTVYKLANRPRSVVAERSRALDSSFGVVRMWVRIPAWTAGRGACVLVLSKTLNHNCFVLRMGCKAVGPACVA